MKVSYEIYVLPGEAPDKVVAAEEHHDDSFVEFAKDITRGLGRSFDDKDDAWDREAYVLIRYGDELQLTDMLWFDTAMMETLQFGLTFKHQQLAGKQGREGTTNVQEMKDHGVL